MRTRTWFALVCALLLAVPAMAQEQVGQIEGIVKDSSGGVLPGVTVEARSATGVVISAVTDNMGVYRFRLAPGVYNVTASLEGFASGKVPDVEVLLGQIKKVDFAMGVAGVAETVQVTAESPLVDVKQSARATSIRGEQVDLLPKGRDFTTLVTQAPGANTEGKLGGLSIDGASAGENRYIVDGIETTNLRSGTSGKDLIADFVEEVQVKSSGYTAEYGGATGGVVNVVTKSGTNDLHGSGLFYFQGSALQRGTCTFGANGTTCAGGRDTLRLNLSNSSIAEYVGYPKDDQVRMEPGFALGGPIARDRAWFFGAYQPALTTTNRTVGSNPEVERKDTAQYVSANITSQFSDKLRMRVAYNNSWSQQKGILPALSGTDPEGTNYGKTFTYPNYSLSANADYVVNSKLFFGMRGGYYMSDQHDTNVTEQVRYRWTTTSNVGLLDVPASLQHGTNFSSIPDNNKVVRDKQTRAYFQVDGTSYLHFGGEHQLKAGVQVDRVGNDVFSGESRPLVTIRWNAALSTGAPVKRGKYGYYEVRTNGVDSTKGFITEGNIHTTNIGLFLQDAWTLNNRLTVNAGIRTEREQVPTYTVGEDIPEFGIEFGFKDKLAPRVGFAYDVKGDGRTKVFGSWGIFYDIFKLQLPRGSFGGEKWLSYYYTLDTFDWPRIAEGASCPPACNGTLIRGPIDFRHVSLGEDSVEPNLKPMRQQEASAGVEHQVSQVIALSARYVHKQLDRAIDDTGFLLPDGSEGYVIANPGEGLTEFAYLDPAVNLPKAQRDYDSVEFAFEKRMANNWYLRTSYLWSRLYGNYSGLSQSDEAGRTDPNVGRAFDYPMMMFKDGGDIANGVLPTDRPHQFKAQFIYTLPFGTAIGANEYIASGTPVTREIGIFPTSNYPVQYLGRGSDGRTPMYSQTDMYVQHEFKVGDNRLQLSFNVLNLFDQKAVTGRYSTYQQVNGVVPDETLFYSGQQTLASLITSQNVTRDARFLMDNAYQYPLQARIGVKFLF